MKEKLKQHKDKLYLILAFISGGGLTQVSDFIFSVREAFSSETRKPKVARQDSIKYIDKEFDLRKAETYK